MNYFNQETTLMAGKFQMKKTLFTFLKVKAEMKSPRKHVSPANTKHVSPANIGKREHISPSRPTKHASPAVQAGKHGSPRKHVSPDKTRPRTTSTSGTGTRLIAKTMSLKTLLMKLQGNIMEVNKKGDEMKHRYFMS